MWVDALAATESSKFCALIYTQKNQTKKNTTHTPFSS